MWRWKNGDNYYIARANALENNVSLYHTQNGRRPRIKYVDVPVARNQLAHVAGEAIKVSLDSQQFIAANDGHISGAGAIGVWTKADSVTAFDDGSQ